MEKILLVDLKKQYEILQADIQKRIQKVFAHGQFILGPEVIELEEQLAHSVGVKHCVSAASGTDALLMALMAIHIEPGDEVITSPFSFFATAEAITLLKAKPVFVDIDPLTFNLDVKKLEQAITKKTKAIVAVSLFGQCPDFDTINQIANSYSLPVIEDGAQSLGSNYKNNNSCGLTTIGCTSFFPTKPLGCYGDGGACFTDDDALAEELRLIRIHGQQTKYLHLRVGINGRLDTLQAAILLAKLAVFPQELAQRRQLAEIYLQHLPPFIKTPYVEPHNVSTYSQFSIQTQKRDLLQNYLKENGIFTEIYYPIPIHLQPALSYLKIPKGSFPHAEKVATSILSLPVHPYLGKSDIMRVCEVIKKWEYMEDFSRVLIN